jgi:hypothetical protein
MRPIAEKYDGKLLYRALDIFVSLESDIRYSSNPRILLESAIIKAADFRDALDEAGLAVRIKKLEDRISGIESGAGLKKDDSAGGAPREAERVTAESPERRNGPERITAERPGGTEKAGIREKNDELISADALVGKLITAFRTKGLFLLYAAFQNVFGAEIRGGSLEIYFSDKTDYDVLCSDKNMAAARDVLEQCAPQLKLEPILKAVKDNNISKEINRLKELFEGADIIVK